MKKDLSIWVIIDHKIGNANQALAIAKAIGLDFKIKALKYNFLAKLPNWLKFDSLIGVDLQNSDNINEPYPDLIISSGRKPAAVTNYIKKLNPSSFAVHLMNPDLPFKNFDLVALPQHDFNEKYADDSNILYSIGAPSYLNKKDLKLAGKDLQARIPKLKGPYVSLIIGGKTKSGDYTEEEMQKLVKQASDLTNKVKGSLLISTSRRTTLATIKNLKDYITAPYFFYNWQLENEQDNPYRGFLSLSDYFIVTGDSVSICSDSLSTGKSVYIYRKNKILYKKHQKFLDYLKQLGYTREIENINLEPEQWKYTPLHEAERIGKTIIEKLNNASPTISI